MHLRLAALALFVLAISSMGCAAKPIAPARIIDTHIHIYDTSRPQGVPWPYKKDVALYEPHLLADFEKVAKANGVTATVIVEASDWVEDNQWLLDLTKNDTHFIGIVGNLLPSTDDFAANLDRFAKDRRFVGIRARTNKPGFKMTDEKYLADLAKLADKNLSLDMLVHGGTLEDLAIVAAKVPNLRIVVNHLAGAKVDGEEPDAKWVAQIKALAVHKNVHCKISGLSQQSTTKPAPMDVNFYRPTLDVLWEAFGEDRLIFASNWPVTKMGGDYAGELRMTREYFAEKGQAATDNVFWENADRVYRLGLKK